MKIVKTQPCVSQFVDVRVLNKTAKAAHLSKANIIEQEYNNIRSSLWGCYFRRPPLLAFFIALGDLSLELLRSTHIISCYGGACHKGCTQ